MKSELQTWSYITKQLFQKEKITICLAVLFTEMLLCEQKQLLYEGHRQQYTWETNTKLMGAIALLSQSQIA